MTSYFGRFDSEISDLKKTHTTTYEAVLNITNGFGVKMCSVLLCYGFAQLLRGLEGFKNK